MSRDRATLKGKRPDRIDASEMRYHAKIIQRVREAQAAQQQLVALQQQVAEADAAFRSWGLHLHERYGLQPGDGVDEDGRITRASQNGDGAAEAAPQ